MKSGKVHHVEQRGPEWWALRRGRVTASRVSDILRTTKNGSAAVARKNYFDELLAERLTEQSVIRYVPSMEARIALEPEARDEYEFYKGASVEEVGFVEHPTIDGAGCSPDGLVKKDGLIEIKACDSKNHIETLRSGIIDPDYLLQMQFQMACTGRRWCDYVGYNPLMKDERLKTFIRRIERDDHCIAKIESAVVDFLAEVEAMVAQLQNES